MPALVVLDRIPVPALAVAVDGAILFANGAFGAMLGHSATALASLRLQEILQHLPIEPSAVTALRARADELVELLHADGLTIRARMSRSVFARNDDQIVLTTFHDLTEKLWDKGTKV